MDPDRPAPGELEVVRVVLNSDDRFHGVDHATDADTLNDHLAQVQPACPALGVSDLAAYRALRDAVRALVVSPRAEAVETVNQLSARHRVVVEVTERGAALLRPPPGAAPSPADQLASRVLVAIHEAMLLGLWPRLHACRRFDCGWVFYDASKNNSGRWCSTDPCGNVMKTRAYRARQHRKVPS